jgi:peptidoglycan/LPS O-acetylase OafA/YrhL
MQVPWRLGRRPALDGIRGAAVLIVIADHAGFLPEPDGGIGVTLFFVLSGFLITRVIVEARESRTWSMAGFVANRFVRLFPALAFMVAVVTGILLARGLPVRNVTARAVPALAYVQNMVPSLSLPVFAHTWSLGVEEQFYLLWPLALPWVMRRARPQAFLALVIAGSVAVEILFPRDWLPMHAYALLAGCALALRRPGPAHRWMFPAGALALAVSMVLGPSFTQLYVYGPMLATPGAVLMVAGALSGNRFLEASPLRLTGRISYAAYLWHVPLLRLTGTTYAGAAAIPPIVLAVIVATASTLIIEEPLRRAWRLRHSAVPATSGSLDPTDRTPSRSV